MATSPAARRPPDCLIPGTPSTWLSRRLVSGNRSLHARVLFWVHPCCRSHVFDGLILQLLGPRVMYGNIANHEAFVRRKLEEQQQAVELQQAIELEGRRFMGLQLLDLTSRGHRLGSPEPMTLGQADGKGSGNGNGYAIIVEDITVQGPFLDPN
jgi:hypothetical protein